MQGFDRFVPLLQLGSVTARQLTAVAYALMRLMPGGLMIFALHIMRRWTAACMRVQAGQLQLELYTSKYALEHISRTQMSPCTSRIRVRAS
jgi:hypothetical protein